MIYPYIYPLDIYRGCNYFSASFSSDTKKEFYEVTIHSENIARHNIYAPDKTNLLCKAETTGNTGEVLETYY